MSIRFDPESCRSIDDTTGEYLEHHFHHYQDPLHHYSLHSKDGEMLLSASVAESRTDTRGDGTVGLIEADVFRVSVPKEAGTLSDVLDDHNPIVQRFVDFLEVRLFDRRVIPQKVVIAMKLGARPSCGNM